MGFNSAFKGIRYRKVVKKSVQLSLLKFSKLNCTLPDDGDLTETCCSCCNFNVNFNTH